MQAKKGEMDNYGRQASNAPMVTRKALNTPPARLPWLLIVCPTTRSANVIVVTEPSWLRSRKRVADVVCTVTILLMYGFTIQLPQEIVTEMVWATASMEEIVPERAYGVRTPELPCSRLPGVACIGGPALT